MVGIKELETEVLDRLAEAGGRLTAEDDVVFEGSKVILPETMTTKDAISFLHQKLEEDEKSMDFSRTFDFKPWDGARAVHTCFKRVFGSYTQHTKTGMFGMEYPPEMRTINVDFEQTEQVPWGMLSVAIMQEVRLELASTRDGRFFVAASGPRKYRFHIEGLFQLILEELKTNSIYQGKAFDGAFEPSFLDLSKVDEGKVFYSEDVTLQLDAHVWSLIKYSEQMRKQNLPLKRAVLFEGPYGTGKTLGAFLTAKIARENNWTFIYCRPTIDNLDQVMQTARLYQPAVVFFEDIDTLSNTSDKDHISKLLDMFDGITAKNTEIICVLTTNHVEKIHKGMVRPGRLDAIIHIGMLDHEGIKNMVKTLLADKDVAGDIDLDRVALSMEGYLPAFIRESVDRATRYSIARNKGKVGKLNTIDLVAAADGLRSQWELMQDAGEGVGPKGIDAAFREMLEGTIITDEDGEEMTIKVN